MYLLLDTSTPVCRVAIIDTDGAWHDYEWQADRQLAHGLLGYLIKVLKERGATPVDIRGIGVFRGPGSFTGLRIGMTVMNTLADDRSIPIVGGEGENWRKEVLQRLKDGGNDRVVVPFYGRDARITTPRK